MAGARIHVDSDQVEAMLRELDNRMKDYKPVFRKAAIYMEGSIGKNFRAQGRPTKWAPLKPKTLAARRKKGSGAKILQDSGLLKASVTSNLEIKRMTKLEYEFGTAKIYAATHQYGRGKIPARPFLLFQDSDEKAIRRIFEDHLKEAFR